MCVDDRFLKNTFLICLGHEAKSVKKHICGFLNCTIFYYTKYEPIPVKNIHSIPHINTQEKDHLKTPDAFMRKKKKKRKITLFSFSVVFERFTALCFSH